MWRRSIALVLLTLVAACDPEEDGPADTAGDVREADSPSDVSPGDDVAGDTASVDAPSDVPATEDAPADDVRPPIPSNEIHGRVRYEDLLFEANGFTGETEWKPARGVEVTLYIGVQERALALTDDEGRFVLTHDAPPGTEARVRASARVREGAQVAQTRSHAGRVHFVQLDVITGTQELVAIDAAASEIGGAFNITDVSLDAFRLIAPHIGEAGPRLSFAWDKGESWPCGSCYNDDVVSLGGQVEDPDEYDDDIILHEFGHYFVEYYSRDSSPGGAHRDRQVSPVLAYGEGIGYFFTLMVTGRDIIVDNFIDGTRTIDFNYYTQNGNDRPGFRGTTDGTIGGRLREEIVGGIMLDAMDPADAREPFDEVALGREGLLELFIDHFGATRPVNQGPAGIDLSDFLWALQCVADVPRASVQALADDREFPWVAPALCE